jgi:hypothetical protein
MSDGSLLEGPDLFQKDTVRRFPWVVLGATYSLGILIAAAGLAYLYGGHSIEIGVGLVGMGFLFGAVTDLTRRQRHASWREQIVDEANYLALQLSRIKQGRDSSDYQNAWRGIQLAREVVNRLWYSESASAPRAWSALHSAAESLVYIGDDDVVREQAVEVEARLAASPLPVTDPRQAHYHETLTAVFATAKLGQPIPESVRKALAEILHTLNDRTERIYGDLRSYVSLVATVVQGLGLTLLLVTIISAFDPLIFPICANSATPHCPGGALEGVFSVQDFPVSDLPSPLDVLYILLLGSFGGWFFALRGLLPLQHGELDSRLYLLQAVIKALTGAVIALIGVLALQRGLLGAYPPQPGDKVFLYALLFGLAQEPLTRVLDKRLRTLIETVQTEGQSRGRRSSAVTARTTSAPAE